MVFMRFKMIKNQVILTFTWVIAVFLCYCGSPKQDKNTSKRQANSISFIEGVVVKSSVVNQSIQVSGSLISFEETVLTPEVTGRVVQINLPEGKFVKKGTLLVKLYDEDLQAQLRRSQAQQLINEETVKRQSELLKINGIAQADYDQSVLQVNSVKADVDVLKVQIRKTEILAPFDGVIGLRSVSIGAEVGNSTPLATIREVNKLKLDFSVPGMYSKEIKPGLKVKFTLQGDETKYEATVIATEEGIDVSTRNLKVRAVVDNTKTTLNPGAFANVEVDLNKNNEALMVPTQAIIPMERNKQLIVAKNGKAKFITVNTGVRQAANVEILKGITKGDTVVTTGILFIKQGEPLKFKKVNLNY